MLITVSREMGAGGARVARGVAEALGWQLVDNQCVDEVARRAGMTPEEVAEQEERAPGFLERLIRSLAHATSEFVPPEKGSLPELEEAELVKLTQAVVAEFGQMGRVVMVGRAAPAVLSTETDAFHVRVVAALGARVASIAQRRGVTMEEAKERVTTTDAARKRYHRLYYDRDWADPVNYHMVLNTSALTEEGTVRVILAHARYLWPEA